MTELGSFDSTIRPSTTPGTSTPPLPNATGRRGTGAVGPMGGLGVQSPWAVDEPDVEVSIVVPTRNEEQNIATLAKRLMAAMPTARRWEMVVVDDSSDTTPQVVEGLLNSGFPGQLLHRPPGHRPGGLGGAVLAGFRASKGRVIVVMDADLQHPPEMVPVLASVAAMGAGDVVIASRFANGGSATGLDGWARRLNSQCTRQLTRLMLANVRSIRDPLSGFFAVRREVVARAPVTSDGFKILVDVLVLGTWSSAVEVPFGFQPRAAGASKADVAQGARFLRQLGRLAVDRSYRSPRTPAPLSHPVPVLSGDR